MPRNIAAEILEGLAEAADHLDGKPAGVRTTTVNVPDKVDVRSIREELALTQAEFPSRFGLPIDTLPQVRGVREGKVAAFPSRCKRSGSGSSMNRAGFVGGSIS